jgi:zinc protease
LDQNGNFPILRAVISLPPIPFEQHRLENGLTLLLHEDRSAPLAAVVAMYHVGSKNETPGRTGFAHLFEHIMFKGSAHVGDGEHFRLLQEIGASVNGSTSEDRTNYYEIVPSTHIELALYLESDRMGFLLPSLTQEKLDNQRDVVKNERRQNYDNQPYGRAHETLTGQLFPPAHPYRWPVIGSMEDLSAATLDDVRRFFSAYYTPSNAVLSIAGDFERETLLELIRRYFGELPPGTPPPPVSVDTPSLNSHSRVVLEDRVRLPRLYLAWHSGRVNTRDDAVFDLLTNHLAVGRNSLLYRTMVYEGQTAQNVFAYQDGMEMSGMAVLSSTAKPRIPLTRIEDQIIGLLDQIARNGITPAEFEAACSAAEVQNVKQRVTAFQRANGLATYHLLTGDAGNFSSHFDRFADITAEELQVAASGLLAAPRVTLSVVPEGALHLAAHG